MFGLFGSSQQEWQYKDLPTPKTLEEYEDLSVNILDKRLRLINSDGWDVLKTAESNDGISIETKPVNGSDVVCVRVKGIVKLNSNQTIDDLLMILHEPTLEQKKKLYESVIEYSILNYINPNIHTSKTIGRTTGITDREFLNMRTYRLMDDGSYLIGIQSINDKSHPFDPNCVRGTSNSGIILTEIDSSTVQITSVDHIDPKGWVPVFVIDSFLGTAGDWIKSL